MSEVGLQLEPLRVPTQTTYPRQYRIAVSAALRYEPIASALRWRENSRRRTAREDFRP